MADGKHEMNTELSKLKEKLKSRSQALLQGIGQMSMAELKVELAKDGVDVDAFLDELRKEGVTITT